jgi:arylsulfatase
MRNSDLVKPHDWLPTFLALAGEPAIRGRLLAGYQLGDRTVQLQLDGYNLLPFLTRRGERTPREASAFFSRWRPRRAERR